MKHNQSNKYFNNDGYRPNVAIVLCNNHNQVFWARRCSHDGWQFPQGGIKPDESIEQAVYRELEEETGLLEDHVKVIGRTREWLRYSLPTLQNKRRWADKSIRGQKQIWYLLRMLADDSEVNLSSERAPEFDAWKWIEYWSAVDNIVGFKRPVYKRALTELADLLSI